jgi:TP53 regulating kinase-like protein
MLIKRGAEADLHLLNWQGQKVVMKRRLPKKYRLPEIDRKIRSYRTIRESQLLHEAKEAGVSTPTVFVVDLEDSNVIMKFIAGNQVKQILDELSFEKQQSLSRYIGKLIGRLHQNNIIHGDLTTSNMILTAESDVVLLDFGLGEKSPELESKGVDLHLMKRALQSTHFGCAEVCFQSVLEGYADVLGPEAANKILHKVKEIEERGRYISGRRRKTN